MKRMNGREHAEAFIRIGVPALLFMLAFNIVSLNFDANDNGNLLPNDGIVESAAPELQSGQVFPSSGNQFTTFIFEVVFFDADNDAPSPMNVVLNGTPTAMPKLYSGDTDYTDGCIYRYTHTMPVGNTSYYFTCTAGAQTNTTTTRYLIVTATNTAPQLSSPDATPGVGSGTAVTTFRVLYIDKENTLPTTINVTYNSSTGASTTTALTQVDAGDTNTVDGKYYSHAVTLTTVGTYQFMFRATDGIYSTATAWISGLLVRPFIDGTPVPVLSSPANNLVRANGSQTFTWVSLSIPTGTVNYTFQFSNSPSFTPGTILIENSSLTTNTITNTMNFSKGTYYWRVRAHQGTYMSGTIIPPCSLACS